MRQLRPLLWGALALALIVSTATMASAMTRPAQPSNLFARATSTTDALLTWSDNAVNEAEYHVEVHTGAAAWTDMGPIPPNATSIQVFGLQPQSTYFFRVRAKNLAGWSLYSNEAAATTFYTTPPSCVQGDSSMCLGGRYLVSATYERPGSATIRGSGHTDALSEETGLFWFFDASNVEAIVKVLDGCAINQRKWVYTTGLTDLRVVIDVVDTQTGATATYLSPGGAPFTPIADTEALPCD